MTIQDLFGPNSTETATEIKISKAGLAAKVAQYMLDYHNDSTSPGFVPTETNPIEAIWVAIQMAGVLHFTQTRFDSAPNNKVLCTTDDVPGFSNLNSRWDFRVNSSLQQDGTVPTLSPANFG